MLYELSDLRIGVIEDIFQTEGKMLLVREYINSREIGYAIVWW